MSKCKPKTYADGQQDMLEKVRSILQRCDCDLLCEHGGKWIFDRFDQLTKEVDNE